MGTVGGGLVVEEHATTANAPRLHHGRIAQASLHPARRARGLRGDDLEDGLVHDVRHVAEVADRSDATLLEIDQDEVRGRSRSRDVRTERKATFQPDHAERDILLLVPPEVHPDLFPASL